MVVGVLLGVWVKHIACALASILHSKLGAAVTFGENEHPALEARCEHLNAAFVTHCVCAGPFFSRLMLLK